MATRIMVIDDEPLICRLLEYQLGGAGYEVTSYQSPYPALLQLTRSQPDLLLLDVMMPEMSGWDLCRQIRSSSSLPIIMLTAKDGDDDVVRGLTGGADDYVGKPFNQAQLVARIEAVLRRTHSVPARPRASTPVRGGAAYTPARDLAAVSSPARARSTAAQTLVLDPAAVSSPARAQSTAAQTLVLDPAAVGASPRPAASVAVSDSAPAQAGARAAAAARLPRLGSRLATARREQGLSLHDAGRAAGVRWEFLQAIEQEEFNYVPREDLRLALRSYSTLLGIDLQPYAARAARRARPAPLPITIGMVAVLAIAIVLVAMVM